ncbi:hypothetical protein [Anoxybacillus sp. FSL W8-1294]|uniref:hypothetical protein n=1 Tax=Anoxybacillus sp. FSL W8-1294 TaxID=2954655 RepID=UPI0030CA9393
MQCYPPHELQQLQHHTFTHFGITFHLSKCPDGQGSILKTTSVKDTFLFFETISPVIHDCPSMYYKTNWNERFKVEKRKWKSKFPNFDIFVSSSERVKPYSTEEIRLLKEMKQEGATIQEIANALQRSYWSVVHKWREIKDK